MEKIKRSLLAIFLNTGSSGSPVWSLIGNGVTEQTINYNPQTTEETYVHQDSGNTDIESYRPNIPTPMTAVKGDPVFAYVDNLRKNRAVLADAESEVCVVYLYEPPIGGEYPAEKNACSIQIDDFGGAGGGKVAINFTINLKGDPVIGTFNPSTKAFTPDSGATYLVTFEVTGTGGARLSGAQIVINSTILTTDANGLASIQLANGSYDYTVTATGYEVEADTVTVSSAAVFEEVTMTAP